MNKKMQKLMKLVIVLMLTALLAACGSEKQEVKSEAAEVSAPSSEETVASAPANEVSEGKEISEKVPSGINEDGMGDDPDFGEGIGEVVALTPEEEAYMLVQTTESWLKMSKQEKDDLVVLVGRSLEDINGFIVPDYDDLIVMLDRQMEQYHRNGVNESVLVSVRDIYKIADGNMANAMG